MRVTTTLEILLLLAVIGAGLGAAVWLVRHLGPLLPGSRRRARFERLVPLLQLGLAAAAIVALTASLLGGRPTTLTLALAALAGVAVASTWFALRDIVAGAVLRAEDAFETGQWIRVEDVEGRVRQVGVRTLELERDDGTSVRIPYARITTSRLVRAGRAEDASSHTFTLELPADRAPVRVLPIIRAAARNCFFVSATRAPHVQVLSGGDVNRYVVTVFTLDRVFVPEIEAAVRRRLADEGAPEEA